MSETTMKAVGLTQYLPIDHPESLLDVKIEKPVPTGRDLLVRVQAVSVNPVDVKVRGPKERTESKPRVLGWAGRPGNHPHDDSREAYADPCGKPAESACDAGNGAFGRQSGAGAV